MDLQEEYWPQSLCLVGQVAVSVVAIIRILDNRDQFPVRQLGPASTIVCILCFLFSNLLSLLGRIIVQDKNIHERSRCFPHELWLLFVMSILYNIMRELPFILFVVKILRVSLCFWPIFNKLNVQKIPKLFVSYLKSQTYFIFGCVVYVSILNLLIIAIYGTKNDFSYLSYQYFCPKLQSSVFEQIISSIRFATLVFVFYLSLWTYQELDFKRFLMLIFLSASLSIIPHLFIVFEDQSDQPLYQRYSIYYTSYLISMFNSCIILYYSGVNKELNQPAMQGVLQSWQAFHNLKLGMNVLQVFAQYKDNNSQTKYNFRCLESYDYLDFILRQRALNSSFQIQNQFQVIEKILQRNQYVKMKLGEATTLQFRQKCTNGTLTIENIKRMERVLSNYCETVIFGDWKKTNSYKFLKDQFINNGDINQKLGLFGIPVS